MSYRCFASRPWNKVNFLDNKFYGIHRYDQDQVHVLLLRREGDGLEVKDVLVSWFLGEMRGNDI